MRNSRAIARLLAVAVLAGGILVRPALAAIEIASNAAQPSRLSIMANDASLDELIDALTDKTGVTIKRVGSLEDISITGVYEGTLPEILPRILRDSDYVLVKGGDPDSPAGGVERVLLMNVKSTAIAVAPAPPPAEAPTPQPSKPARERGGETFQPGLTVMNMMQRQAMQFMDPEAATAMAEQLGMADPAADTQPTDLFQGGVVDDSAGPATQARLEELDRRGAAELRALVESLRRACPPELNCRP